MNDTPSRYNGGRYEFQQQTFCLSMLTCLSFNLTGSEAAITKKFRTLVENVLNNPAARELIGTWSLVWGPVVYADAFVGAKTSVNSMFIAVPAAHPDQAVLAIAGTNGISLMGWMIEDFNVKEKVVWPYGQTSLNPHVSKGVAYGLEKLQNLAEKNPSTGAAVTVRDFLATYPGIKRLMVTGHSLGGALSSVYSLYLEDTRAEWDPSGTIELGCLNTAGQSPGDADFSKYYGEKLGAVTTRIYNALDIVSLAFEKDHLLKIPAIYEPHIAVQRPVVKLIANIRRETEDKHYLNVMPDTAGFSSPFLRIEDLSGEKYQPFIEFIENITKLVKRMNPFGAKDVIGTVGFVVHALVQHIFPYFSHFKIDEFIKIMCVPAAKSARVEPGANTAPAHRSFRQLLEAWWKRLRSFFKRS